MMTFMKYQRFHKYCRILLERNCQLNIKRTEDGALQKLFLTLILFGKRVQDIPS